MKYLLRFLPLLLLTGCWTPGVLTNWLPQDDPAKQHVVIFGDSLTWDAQNYTKSLYAADPNVVLSHNSFGGTTVQDWLDEMAMVPAGSIDVVALGTNDTMLLKGDLDLWKAMEALNTLAKQKSSCIVWLTLNPTTASYDVVRNRESTEYSNDLRLMAGMNNWPLHLYEWAEQSNGHTEWLNLPNDYVHMTDDGKHVYAQALYDAHNSCGSN